MESAAPVDFAEEADLFWSSSARRRPAKGAMRFRSFATLAEAVRFVVTDKSETRHQCAIDTSAKRYEGSEIEALYNSPAFPSEA